MLREVRHTNVSWSYFLPGCRCEPGENCLAIYPWPSRVSYPCLYAYICVRRISSTDPAMWSYYCPFYLVLLLKMWDDIELYVCILCQTDKIDKQERRFSRRIACRHMAMGLGLDGFC